MKERLQKQHIQKLNIRAVSDASGSMCPDEQTIGEANYALKHGFIRATGVDVQDKKVTASIQNHPLLEAASYDPDLITELSAFQRAVIYIRERLKRLAPPNIQPTVKDGG